MPRYRKRPGKQPKPKRPPNPELMRKRQRYGNKLLRLYYDSNLIAGYFLGEIPSVNEITLDVHKLKRRAPTSQVRIFVKAVLDWLEQYREYRPDFKFFELDISVFIPLYAEGGKVITRDASNFVKISEDSICKALGTDDKFNLDVSVHKRNLLPEQQPHWTFVLIGRNHEQHKEEGNEERFPSIAFKRAAEAGKGWQPQVPLKGR